MINDIVSVMKFFLQIFTVKHFCRSLFFNKVAGLWPVQLY